MSNDPLDMTTRYLQFSIEDFLQDDFFIQSCINPSIETSRYWEDLHQKNLINAEQFQMAQDFIANLQPSREYISQEEMDDLWAKIEIINKRKLRNRIKRLYWISSVVAGLLLIVASSFFIFSRKTLFEDVSRIENVKKPELKNDDVFLVLAGEREVSIQGKEVDIKHTEGEVKVNDDPIFSQEEVGNPASFNQLIVPFGKRTTLTLSDGTRLWVNAGSRVVYPSEFKTKNREIYVDGEAFLDVTHDVHHPFIVKTKHLDVTVLGTTFNITAYETDTIQSLILVSGLVRLKQESNHEIILEPNKMFVCSNNNRPSVRTVDVSDYISWKDGMYQYHSENLEAILKRLQRYYGVNIYCDQESASLKCSGKLDLKDSLDSILSGIAETAPIKYNHIEGKYIIKINHVK